MAYTTRHFGCTAEESVRHIGSAAEESGHFGSIPLLPKCLAAEMSYWRSVRTPVFRRPAQSAAGARSLRRVAANSVNSLLDRHAVN